MNRDNGKINVWKCKLIFPTDTLQQKIEITDLKPFLAGKNSVLIILATTDKHMQWDIFTWNSKQPFSNALASAKQQPKTC